MHNIYIFSENLLKNSKVSLENLLENLGRVGLS